MIIYRQIKDRDGEGAALANLGVAYDSLGEYTKAIEYHTSSLAIPRLPRVAPSPKRFLISRAIAKWEV
ncbi:MAG: tetratricopeptide repeat protein [Sphaerospermopsis kisseleviana]